MVSIITVTMRSRYMYNIFFNYARQKWKNKRLIIILNNDALDLHKWREKAKQFDKVSVYKLPEKYTLGKCLNWAIARVKSEVIAKFDDDDYYAPYYLEESMLALKEGKASIVGKHTSYMYFEENKTLMIFRQGFEHRFVKRVKGGTLLFNKSAWRKIKFNEQKIAGSDSRWLLDCYRKGIKTYSISKANYVCIRRKNPKTHTQKRSTAKYMRRCRFVCITDNYTPYITKNLRLAHLDERGELRS